MPLADLLAKVCPTAAAPIQHNLTDNLNHWKELKAQSYLTPHQSHVPLPESTHLTNAAN